MPNSNAEVPDRDYCILDLETKLDDTVELLHMWKGEAFSYRQLVEAVVSGRFSLSKARGLLESHLSCSGDLGLGFSDSGFVVLQLRAEEQKSVEVAAERSGLELHEFLWACVDTTMSCADDPDILQGCYDAVHRRFREGKLSEWVLGTADERE